MIRIRVFSRQADTNEILVTPQTNYSRINAAACRETVSTVSTSLAKAMDKTLKPAVKTEVMAISFHGEGMSSRTSGSDRTDASSQKEPARIV
ncbi:MAG TPA: hypothetical protein VLC51_05180, partial [Nitrospira sp.]|nr:hypothetical protein [Nitrospira sp.]